MLSSKLIKTIAIPTSADGWKGFGLVVLFSALAMQISEISFMKSAGLSALIIGIIIGMVFANTYRHRLPANYAQGLVFSTRTLLRWGIILYGFKVTLQDILTVGAPGMIAAVMVVSSTFILGTFIGQKVFKLDRQTAYLTAAGSSVCGAAAVLAMEPVVKAESHKSIVAVSTVVLFGTISMFLVPFLYNSGFLLFSEEHTGIYIGAVVHEVAHVVGAGNAIGEVAASNAIIVKMTRVLLLAPLLIIVGIWISARGLDTWEKPENQKDKSKKKIHIVIPWFAVGFLVSVIINSLGLIPQTLHKAILYLDVLLLTAAMTALGMDSSWKKMRASGPGPLYTAAIMFVWLIIGGFFITAFSIQFCFGVCGVGR
jgi:uncharacterized integral membrane protein (TIGR00698 family)